MPTSIFNVEIDDEQFKRFAALVEKHKDQVDSLPRGWGKVDKMVDAVSARIVGIQDSLGIQRTSIDKMRYGMDGLTRSTSNADRVMGSLASRTASVARNVAATTLQLIRWAGLGTLASGLLGAGGLFGLSRLADTASAVRRTSQGLGVFGGELQAFQTNFSKAFDPRSVLANVQEAKNDPARQWAFATMGIDNARNRSTADLALELPERARSIYLEGGRNADFAKARGLTEFFSIEDLNRLAEMTDLELQQARRRYDADQRQFAVTDRMRQSWQLLDIQLTRAGTTLENDFLRALSPLAPELEKLSDSFTTAVRSVLTTETLRDVVEGVAGGIRRAGEYLSSDKFRSDLREFGASIEALWGGLQRVARWLSGWVGDRDAATREPLAPLHYGPMLRGAGAPGVMIPAFPIFPNDVDQLPGIPTEGGGGDGVGARAARWRAMGAIGSRPDPQGRMPGQAGYDPVGAAEAAYLPTRGLMDRIWSAESGRGQSMTGPVTRSGERAQGHFQFMPGTGREFGLTRPEDFNDLGRSSDAAARYMGYLIEKFQGNLVAAVAAYNFGPRNVERTMERATAERREWSDLLPRETRDYLARVLGGRAPTQVVVRVENPAGASVSTIASAAVAQ